MKDIIYHSGCCPEGTNIDWADATSGKTRTVRKVVSSTPISIGEFDFREALETELKWLGEKNIVTGLTEEDIRYIASTVKVGSTGYNVRTQWRDGEWVVGPETKIKLRGTAGSYVSDLPSGNFTTEKLSGESVGERETDWTFIGSILGGSHSSRSFSSWQVGRGIENSLTPNLHQG